MDTCKNCGKPLENPDQELCPACRAVENAKARTRREEKAGHARRRRMNRTTRKMLIAVCVLAVVFTGLCVTATVMYDKYNPDEFIASVDAALEAGDARALKNLLKGEDLTVSDEGAAALCRAFTDAAQREALRGQLEDQVVDGGAQGAFPALGVEKESVFCTGRIPVNMDWNWQKILALPNLRPLNSTPKYKEVINMPLINLRPTL